MTVSRQHKTPESQGPIERPAEVSPDVGRDPAVEQAVGLGNAAFAERLGGGEHDAPALAVDTGAIREVAAPMVDRAILALQIVPHFPGQVDGFVATIEASSLPADRKAALVDKLRDDEATATGIHDAVVRAAGADDADVRGELCDALDTVHRALRDGRVDEAAHTLAAGDRIVPLSEAARDGAVHDRAEAMIRDVAAAVVASGPLAGRGDAARDLVRDVHLALVWAEEEEEEEVSDVEAPEEA